MLVCITELNLTDSGPAGLLCICQDIYNVLQHSIVWWLSENSVSNCDAVTPIETAPPVGLV